MAFSFPRLVPAEELERLQEDNARMAAELEEWQALGPWVEVGRLLQDQVVQLLESDATAEDVGELAYKNVLAGMVEKGRADLVIKYEREHRQALYGRMVDEVEADEGPDILASVMTRLDSDVSLATELRDSARKELTAKAIGVAKDSVTAEQEKVIAAETERLMALDKIDVRFALTGMVELDSDIKELLVPGDKLVVMFRKDSGGQAGVRFVWASDINGAEGWTVGGQILTSRNAYYTNSSRVELGGVPKDRFVIPGARMPDLESGRTGFKTNVIRADHPVALSWRNSGGESEIVPIKTSVREDPYAYSNTSKVPHVATIDFQTRDLDFVKQNY